MAIKLNLVLEQGANFSNTFVANYANGDIIDLTGHTVAAQARKHEGSNTAITFNSNVASNTAGAIELLLDSANTELLIPGRYKWDCNITLTANTLVTRIREGILTITPEMTKV